MKVPNFPIFMTGKECVEDNSAMNEESDNKKSVDWNMKTIVNNDEYNGKEKNDAYSKKRNEEFKKTTERSKKAREIKVNEKGSVMIVVRITRMIIIQILTN
jgi:hypothetical protein